MSSLKVFVHKGENVIEKFYINVLGGQFDKLKSQVEERINRNDFDMSWIDIDNDEISLKNFEDFLHCHAQFKHRALESTVSPFKIYVRIKEDPKEDKRVSFSIATDTKAPGPEGPLFMHTDIICDGCDGTVYGFRYKCLQCPNYDLCMTCEGKMFHGDHLMLRIPGNPVAPLPMKLDRVLNLGRLFTPPSGERACGKDWSHEEKKWRKEEEKLRKCAEKYRRMDEKAHRREDKREEKERRRCPATQRPHVGVSPTMPQGQGFFETAMDFLNYMMNPDNIMASHATTPSAPTAAPQPNPTATSPSTDKAQEAQEKAQSPSAPEGQEAPSFLQPRISTAVPLGTDANSMTTSVGVPAAEDVQKPETTGLYPTIPKEDTSSTDAAKEEESFVKPLSNSSSDSDLSKDDEKWTVIDDEEPGAVGGQDKQDKATSTDSESSSSSTKSLNPTAPAFERPRSLKELGEELRAHIEAQAAKRPVTVPSTYPHPAPVSPVAPVVHHHIPHINDAVATMIGMGFSNEGGWLANLLATVNGDITKALDQLLQHK